MDYALQVHQAKYIFPIPDGLKELSSDIIREVLRQQPEHINGFIADYLETMLIVRENARDSGITVCDVFRDGVFFDDLFKTKAITRDQAHKQATVIQSAWRGYVVRKKVADWLKKKKKFEEEQERKRSMKIEEILDGLGITYGEATRAAALIQTAYKDSKRERGYSADYWMGEAVPFGQRIREGDRALGRFDRWEKEDFGDFFEMDEAGAIKYVWPKVGQLRRVLREDVPQDATIVEFFAMRDLDGREQYSYLIKPNEGTEARGIPIGFLSPIPKSYVTNSPQEVEFLNPENASRMGHYTYVYRDDCTREDLEKFEEILKARAKGPFAQESELAGEFDYDPLWVLPRALVRIQKKLLLETDNEVKFLSLPAVIVCEPENYTFRAETLEMTAKIIRHILRDNCLTVEEGLIEASNMAPYKPQETGRIIPVNIFQNPQYIQKIHIQPESATGEEDTVELGRYAYIFVPLSDVKYTRLGTSQPLMEIPVSRFQGYHSEYKGSVDLDNKVFIMGPKITTPNGKPFTFESLFWDEFGEEAWHQLLSSLTAQESLEEEYEREIHEEYTEVGSESVSDFLGETEKDVQSNEQSTEKSDRTQTSKTQTETIRYSKETTQQYRESPGEAKTEILGEDK